MRALGLRGITDPPTRFTLTDTKGPFSNEWFFAAGPARTKMFDVAPPADRFKQRVHELNPPLFGTDEGRPYAL
jgi:hypothetical protein